MKNPSVAARRWQASKVGESDTIVVIEDDNHISDLVAMYLRRDGFRVLQADDGEAGLQYVARDKPKLVVLDLGLPGALDGLDVCRRLRAANVDVPVVILTARDDEVDRVLGLELGADDYVTKPFSARELVARVHAILRRAAGPVREAPAVVEIGDVVVDTGRREALNPSGPVPLTTREFTSSPISPPTGAWRSAAGSCSTACGRGLVRRRAHGRRARPAAPEKAGRRPPALHGVGRRVPARLIEGRCAGA